MAKVVQQGRREFLKHAGAGSVLVAMPPFLAGCGVMPATDLGPAPPANPFLDWFGIDQAMMSRVMSELTARGADHAELYFQHRRTRQLQYANGEISEPQADIEQGVGLRVVVAGQVGFAATEDLTLTAMLATARRAAAGAASASVLSPSRFEQRTAPDNYPVAHHWSDIAIEQRLSVLERAAQAATAGNSEVAGVAMNWQDTDERVLIATLDGNYVTDRRPLTRLSLQVEVQRGGEGHSGFASVSARQGLDWYTDAKLQQLASEARDRARLRFEARRPPLGEMPVVLAAGTGGIILHEALGHTLEADFNAALQGPYRDRIGEQVAAPAVSVIDDATMRHERGAYNVDDEGTDGQRNVLIENGVLRTYLHDRLSARRLGRAANGCGRRESFRFSPMPRMSCTRIANGSHAPEEILRAVDKGIWATTFTDGQVDPLTGEFSFAVNAGWLLDKGKATMPIRDVRIRGVGPEMLQRMTMVGNDGTMDSAGWTCGKRGQQVPVSHGMPTALVSRLLVSG